MKKFTAKQFHENPSEVYRQAARGAVIITHRHHGKMILRSVDKIEEGIGLSTYNIVTGIDVTKLDQEEFREELKRVCESIPRALLGIPDLGQIAKSNPEEYMKHVTEEMMRDYT